MYDGDETLVFHYNLTLYLMIKGTVSKE